MSISTRGVPRIDASAGTSLYHWTMAESASHRIYLDYNATTPVFPEVIEAMRACWAEPYLNPASQHEFGRRARRVLEDARERIGELLGATPDDRVVFTSGGTESNNLAVRGLLARTASIYVESPPLGATVHLIISAAEHPSITMLAHELQRYGHEFDVMPLNTYGSIRVDSLNQLFRSNTALVAAILGQNETGVLQPVGELHSICRDHGIPLHTDASQVAGKLPINFRELGVTTMTVAAHKFGGPVGIGALVIHEHWEFRPQLLGGFQQAGTRPGTESVALAVGMCRALESWDADRKSRVDRMHDLRERFENAILAGYPTAVLIGAKAERLPHVSNIAFLGLDRQQLFLALDQAGVACSTGSACASGSSEPSPVHVAMGCDPAVISSALRFSFGVQTTLAEVDEAARRILQVCNNLRREK
jgi:cysteine desulfurase